MSLLRNHCIQLSLKIVGIAGLSTEFVLNTTPSDPSAIEVFVDGTSVAEDPDNGWTYDAATRTVTALTGESPTDQALEVRIGEGCP